MALHNSCTKKSIMRKISVDCLILECLTKSDIIIINNPKRGLTDTDNETLRYNIELLLNSRYDVQLNPYTHNKFGDQYCEIIEMCKNYFPDVKISSLELTYDGTVYRYYNERAFKSTELGEHVLATPEFVNSSPHGCSII